MSEPKQSLGTELREHHEEIVQRWYERWRRSSHPRHQITEAALKNSLGAQLQLIGEQLLDLDTAERIEDIWTITERLQPEARVNQAMPIEEVVEEYDLAIDVVRMWIAERSIDVPFTEYSYFFRAMFELTAESVRRYTNYQAEQVRRDRAQYLASVMHQLRTPLSALHMQLELAERREGPQLDSEVIGRLRRHIRRVKVLVDAILRLERFQTWEVPVRPEAVCPAHLVDEIVSDHEVEAARKGLQLEAHVNRSLQMTLDPDLFIDALGNLVQNAVKYTTRGSVIVDAEEKPDNVLFCVRDSGPGIPPDEQNRLFKHVQPGSAGGAGIGLRIAQHAAQAQGGRIHVESEVGKGSVFSLRLPRQVPPRNAQCESKRPD